MIILIQFSIRAIGSWYFIKTKLWIQSYHYFLTILNICFVVVVQRRSVPVLGEGSAGVRGAAARRRLVAERRQLDVAVGFGFLSWVLQVKRSASIFSTFLQVNCRLWLSFISITGKTVSFDFLSPLLQVNFRLRLSLIIITGKLSASVFFYMYYR